MIENEKFTYVIDHYVARITLTNPEKHNAFDDMLIAQLTQCFEKLGDDSDVRVILLEANGKSFSAGADLNWMRRMANYSHDENLQDAKALAKLMQVIATNKKPVVAKVQGAAIGGGLGLVACCDIAIASDQAIFSLSEVKLGLTPATISPYVIAAIGQRAARRYFVTAEKFSATTAHQLGLVHDVVTADQLDEKVESLIDSICRNSPTAVGAAKALIYDVKPAPDAEIIEKTAEQIAEIRATAEGQEGLNAFLEKRKPDWLIAYQSTEKS